MKQVIFILSIFMTPVLFTGIQAQENLPYKSWKEFNGDTIQYLEYNFTTRQEQYQGKKISEILKDLELPITNVGEVTRATGTNENGQFKSQLVSMSLTIRQLAEVPSALYDYYITIFFVDYKSKGVKFPPGEKWTSEMTDAIKDEEASNVCSNFYIIARREKEKAEKKN
jgi:hypothetical protein